MDTVVAIGMACRACEYCVISGVATVVVVPITLGLFKKSVDGFPFVARFSVNDWSNRNRLIFFRDWFVIEICVPTKVESRNERIQRDP
jgi:hypothetical protein